ncbi:hypothetical protein PMNALOAF_0767 [Methylobacterium adhaesivum]|jgi:BMFP domain-containing protein YqiC|uniref:Uncharacterized protein n=1 Tax=Methylobacterium adhaesivum TaxID=333297 RepID=A0ABT8BG86_9HYPH|nr:hypothetical protein [Methylobacterium adhaesivum]MDN3591076.1 hypothetical protein [Methylobacterium adhaesivum]GJD29534.1 hypothetical protein PMNALOAF_0767 [Methylobacterium adhaesivum]
MPVETLNRQLEEALRQPTEARRQEAIVHVLARAIREVASLQGRVADLEQRVKHNDETGTPANICVI